MGASLTESDLFRDQRGVPTDFLDKVIIFHDQRGIPNDPLGIVIIFCGQGGSQLTFLRKWSHFIILESHLYFRRIY